MIASHLPREQMFTYQATNEYALLATETGERKDERQRQENVNDRPDSKGPARWGDLCVELSRDVASGIQKWI